MPSALSLCIVLGMVWVGCLHGDPLNFLGDTIRVANVALVHSFNIILPITAEASVCGLDSIADGSGRRGRGSSRRDT